MRMCAAAIALRTRTLRCQPSLGIDSESLKAQRASSEDACGGGSTGDGVLDAAMGRGLNDVAGAAARPRPDLDADAREVPSAIDLVCCGVGVALRNCKTAVQTKPTRFRALDCRRGQGLCPHTRFASTGFGNRLEDLAHDDCDLTMSKFGLPVTENGVRDLHFRCKGQASVAANMPPLTLVTMVCEQGCDGSGTGVHNFDPCSTLRIAVPCNND